jgi:DnaJ-class molecular chaperone
MERTIPCVSCHGTGIMEWQSTTTNEKSYTTCCNCGGRGRVIVWVASEIKFGPPPKGGTKESV